MILILKGKSAKGKQRIKQHGERWIVEQTSFCAALGDTGLLIRSESSGEKRWVKQENDRDFDITDHPT